jgi:hypothetical protein
MPFSPPLDNPSRTATSHFRDVQASNRQEISFDSKDHAPLSKHQNYPEKLQIKGSALLDLIHPEL